MKRSLLESTTYIVAVIFCLVISLGESNYQKPQHGNTHGSGAVSNYTLTGTITGCKHQSTYFVTSNVQFPMCMGQTDQDLKNGMSIINLINSRGYLPTCRILHLLLWMSSVVHEKSTLPRDYFVDIGANIG